MSGSSRTCVRVCWGGQEREDTARIVRPVSTKQTGVASATGTVTATATTAVDAVDAVYAAAAAAADAPAYAPRAWNDALWMAGLLLWPTGLPTMP